MGINKLFNLFSRNDKESSEQVLADSIKKRSVIKDPTTDSFVKTGAQAAKIISDEIKKQIGSLSSSTRILDYGAGSGRVAIPLSKILDEVELHCTDVDAESISYLEQNIRENCVAKLNQYIPPLDYPDDYFDCMYSISVWSHFPEDLGMDWLQEMRRVTKPGALLLISTAGERVLHEWKGSGAQWKDVTIEEFEQKQIIYKEFLNLETNSEFYPGISGTGSWGNTLIHPKYIEKVWSKYFNIIEVRAAGMNGFQDLVIMRNSK